MTSPVNNGITHSWMIQEIDSGHLGLVDFWTCVGCGASGGQASLFNHDDDVRQNRLTPFFPGSSITLSESCSETREIITKYKTTDKWKKQYLETKLWEANWFLKYTDKYGVVGVVDKSAGILGGIPDPNGIKQVVHDNGDTTKLSKWFWLEPRNDVIDRCDDSGWQLTIDGVLIEGVSQFSEVLRKLREFLG